MNIVHQDLAAGRWQTLSLMEQMANIGSEVDRCFNAQQNNKLDRAQQAFERALELIDLTLACPAHKGRRKEIGRAREFLVDTFMGFREYNVPAEYLKKYFLDFALAVRNNV